MVNDVAMFVVLSEVSVRNRIHILKVTELCLCELLAAWPYFFVCFQDGSHSFNDCGSCCFGNPEMDMVSSSLRLTITQKFTYAEQFLCACVCVCVWSLVKGRTFDAGTDTTCIRPGSVLASKAQNPPRCFSATWVKSPKRYQHSKVGLSSHAVQKPFSFS